MINSKPNPPQNLSSITNFNSATLSWDKATDTETPQDGLSYNIYIYYYPKEKNVQLPMSDLDTGFRKVVSSGNINNNTTYTIKNLPIGTYCWSVQAVDHGFAGSFFSGLEYFEIGPWIQADDNGISLTWDEYSGANGYNIYKSDNPEALVFDLLVSNVQNLYYDDTLGEDGQEIFFYYIDAVVSSSVIKSGKVGYRKSLCYNPATTDYNDISLPFDQFVSSSQLDPNGNKFRSISKWNAEYQSWLTSTYFSSPSYKRWLGSFFVFAGQSYRISTLSNDFYFYNYGVYRELGHYDLITTSYSTDMNFIMVPLSEYSLTMAGDDMGDDIVYCDQIARLKASEQISQVTMNNSGIFWDYDYSINIAEPVMDGITENTEWPNIGVKGNVIIKSENVTEVNLPKAVYFHVVNALNEDYNFNDTNPNIESTQPVDGFISFKAWITNREEDILTEQNYGCGFEQLGGLYSTVYINLGNFKYKWAENDVINIEIADNSKNSSVVLKGIGKSLASYDEESSLRGFEPIIKGTGDPIVLDVPSGNDEMIPYQTVLFQNYPNPFNPATEIKFSLKNDSNVKLFVYNYNGQLVRELVNGKLFKGFHSVNFDANALSSGLYFYTLVADGQKFVKKMVLTR